MIRPAKALVSIEERAETSLESPRAGALFFSKGGATAEGFRPAFWTYETADMPKPLAMTDCAPQPFDDGAADLAQLEAEFIETQQRLLEQPRPFPEDYDAPEEKSARADGDVFAPEADLRTIVIRPLARKESAGSDVLVDLFAKKTDLPPVVPRAEPPKDAAAASARPVRTARAAKPAPQAGASARVTVLTCACAALAVIFAGRSARVPPSVPPVVVAQVSVPPAAAVAAPAAVAVPAAAVAAPAAPVRPNAAAEALIVQGNHYLALHDIESARLCFERASEQGSGEAALLAGMTFDPLFLAKAGVIGLKGDDGEAQSWYRRARDLGDADAAKFLSRP